jgi:hypothetical protein
MRPDAREEEDDEFGVAAGLSETRGMRSAIAAFVVVTVAVGLLLSAGMPGISPMTRWLAALAVGVIAAWLVAQPGGRRRGDRPEPYDDGPPEHRCPLCAGTGLDPHDRARRDTPSPARCRLCGGRGFVDSI